MRCSDSDCRQPIGDIVLPQKRQHEIHILASVMDRESGTVQSQVLNLLDFERCHRFYAIRDNFSVELARHSAHARVIVIEIRRFRIMQAFEKLGFGLGDLVHGLEKLQVYRIHIGNHARVRLRN